MDKNKELHFVRSFATDLKIRETEGDAPSRTITGYTILFNTRSRALYKDSREEAYEMIAPEAITKEILDTQDIKMTMFHNRELILARSNKGGGSLSYEVDDKGVRFEFDAPATVDGEKALELVRRGDIAGCSFAFSTRYYDEDFVERQISASDNLKVVTYIVRKVTGVYDFTLAADPAYPETSVETEAREIAKEFAKTEEDDANANREKVDAQVRQMRESAKTFKQNIF